MRNDTTPPPKSCVWRQLQDWFGGEQGTTLLAVEHDRIGRRLCTLFGYHILQVGGMDGVDFLAENKISHKMIASLADNETLPSFAGLRCDAGKLPFATDSIDVVVLPHVLEFDEQPHQVLRESERVLIGDGHLVILGFNPWSLWGVLRWLLGWRQLVPWCGHSIRLARLKDWLTLLDFEIVSAESFYFRPPLCSTKCLNRYQWMEYLGGRFWRWFGGVYLLVAKKCVRPLTPIKLAWRNRREIIATGTVGTPTNRKAP